MLTQGLKQLPTCRCYKLRSPIRAFEVELLQPPPTARDAVYSAARTMLACRAAARRPQLLWPSMAARRAISLGASAPRLLARHRAAPLHRFATTKTTTGIVGLPVDPHARETLIALNE